MKLININFFWWSCSFIIILFSTSFWIIFNTHFERYDFYILSMVNKFKREIMHINDSKFEELNQTTFGNNTKKNTLTHFSSLMCVQTISVWLIYRILKVKFKISIVRPPTCICSHKLGVKQRLIEPISLSNQL